MTDLVQIMYSSRPFGFDVAALNSILINDQQNNARSGITGALLCRRDIYLQLLEGERAAVEATYERIFADGRHVEGRKRVGQSASQRLFSQWAMYHERQPVIWSPADVSSGALDQATPADFMDVFKTVAANASAKA